jgi:hypothetical protein
MVRSLIPSNAARSAAGSAPAADEVDGAGVATVVLDGCVLEQPASARTRRVVRRGMRAIILWSETEGKLDGGAGSREEGGAPDRCKLGLVAVARVLPVVLLFPPPSSVSRDATLSPVAASEFRCQRYFVFLSLVSGWTIAS